MEKELKVAELATIWGVSVPTTWNRIRKEGLTTFTKKNEINKTITYVNISDEILNSYVVNPNNNLNKDVNNGLYEDMLTNNNLNNGINSTISGNFVDDIITINNDFNQQLLTINERYESRLERLREELTTVKSQTLYLEQKDKDISSRESLYLNDINEYKQNISRYKRLLTISITVIIVLLMVIIGYLTYNYGVNKGSFTPTPITDSIMQEIEK